MARPPRRLLLSAGAWLTGSLGASRLPWRATGLSIARVGGSGALLGSNSGSLPVIAGLEVRDVFFLFLPKHHSHKYSKTRRGENYQEARKGSKTTLEQPLAICFFLPFLFQFSKSPGGKKEKEKNKDNQIQNERSRNVRRFSISRHPPAQPRAYYPN